MASRHETTQTCPICHESTVQHVHCSFEACAFVVTTCPRCDREQAVNAFVADHEKDCVHRTVVAPVVISYATFRAPQKVA